MQSERKILAFDLGNVLFSFDYTVTLNKIKDRMKATIPEVMLSLYEKNFTIPFEKGLVSGRQFHQEFMCEFGLSLSYAQFVDVWCKIFFPKPEIIELVEFLKNKHRLYLISNINQLHFDYLYQEHRQVFACFQGLILSYAVRSVKPELKIYQALSRSAGVDFSDIIYIDDRQDLIAEALKLKFNCIHFSNYSQLLKDLESFGLILACKRKNI